ncbi:unnamed protein product (macronuclear) [Paramecium tetraurelia]|uniref:Uncharacterized protein n=1 Tax=Paramecium tetraurelia TaxID=5888 RepID=A0DUD8_PARTE|nr:uncharacterized protein GSPATT00020327001 [Paramecium tetraurelia]CAK86655.1 unnamed protein product [Paramecium tetraurelia]|eukprot:XP_001454052.1 hypothetical protein (macronuclear) [Paramecium tetraurelia strain d4-2]
MSSEINIRQLLYYKHLNPSPTQQSLRTVKTMQHRLNQLRSSAQSDFRLTTLQTQTPVHNFRYGFNADEHQNQNSQIHFLEAFDYPFRYINSYITESKRNIAQLQDQSNRIRLEMSNIISKSESELNQIQVNFRESLNKKYKQLREDNVQFIEAQYKLSKEYQRLAKARQMMEEKHLLLLQKVVQLENTLQGVTLELQQ